MNILLVAINAKYIHSNLAVHSLKKYANKDENQISVAEFTINNLTDEILNGIYMKKPDILAFSCYIWNIEFVKRVIGEVKKIIPNVRIWLGGPEAYNNSKALFLECKDIDLIMKGEGEQTFKELADFYLQEENEDKKEKEVQFLRSVSGIEFRDNDDIISNPDRQLMDMSMIPFPYDNIADFNNKIIYYESSRGCPFSCSYCLSSVDKQLRFRNIELVKEELKFFLDNQVAQVKFVDRTFNCKKSHCIEILKFILENDNGITNFHFEVAADLMDEEELEIISKMRPGAIQLEIGIQSTNPCTIKEIRRVMDIEKVKKIVSKVKSFKNTHQHLDLIAGLPYEDLDSFKNSFNEVYSMEPDELQLGFLKVLSGSYMYSQKDNYDIKYRAYPGYEVLSTKWLSYDEMLLLKGVEEMVEVYYNSRQFAMTLKYIEKWFDKPFNMFYELSKYYEDHFDKNIKHSRIARYNVLRDFCMEYFSDCPEFMIERVDMYMTFDIYLRENAKSRPGFARDNACYKDIVKEFARDNDLKRNEHIEILTIEEYDCLNIENISKLEDLGVYYFSDKGNIINNDESLIFIVFDYDYKDPITNQCRIKISRVKYGVKEC